MSAASSRRAAVLAVALAVVAGALLLVLRGATPGAAATPAGRFVFLQTVDHGRTYRLYEATAAGRDVHLVSTHRAIGRASISRNGRRVFFSGPVSDGSDGRYGLFAVSVDGTGLAQLSAPRFADSDPALSPNGAMVAFSRNTNGNLLSSCCAIYRMAPTGRSVTSVPGTRGGRMPAWSPDSTRIAYIAPDGLRVMRRDGSANHRLVAGALRDPAWSPDGRRIAFVQATSGSHSRITVVASGGGPVSVAENTAGYAESPAWEPDGSALFYVLFHGVGMEGRRDASVLRVTTPGGAQVRAFRLATPLYRLAYLAAPHGGTGIGAVTDAAGTLSWQVTDDTAGAAPAATVTASFGQTGDTPVTGDWNGDGAVTPGVVRAVGGVLEWHLSDELAAPRGDYSFDFGAAGDVPVTGDWNGDGTTSPGTVRRTGSTWTWSLAAHPDGTGPVTTVAFGDPTAGDIPVAGDWDGDGRTTIGVVRPTPSGLEWLVTNTLSAPALPASGPIFGQVGDVPVPGDWDGDGATSEGVAHRGADGSLQWQLATGFASPVLAHTPTFGSSGDVPVAGDWDAR